LAGLLIIIWRFWLSPASFPLLLHGPWSVPLSTPMHIVFLEVL
jgi:hypothetical protein